jgi:hypothetical protein
MRRHAVLTLIVVLLGALAVQAAEETITGTISDWNDTDRRFRVRTSGGDQVAITWDGATQVYGTARVGQQVTVTAKREGGKLIATRIVIGAEKPPKD